MILVNVSVGSTKGVENPQNVPLKTHEIFPQKILTQNNFYLLRNLLQFSLGGICIRKIRYERRGKSIF